MSCSFWPAFTSPATLVKPHISWNTLLLSEQVNHAIPSAKVRLIMTNNLCFGWLWILPLVGQPSILNYDLFTWHHHPTNLHQHRYVMITILWDFALASYVFMPTRVCLAVALIPSTLPSSCKSDLYPHICSIKPTVSWGQVSSIQKYCPINPTF